MTTLPTDGESPHTVPPVQIPASIARSRIVPIGSGKYLLTEPLIAQVDELGVAVHVPSHYVTDLASIPRLAWWCIGHPATGEYQDAAIIHDWICDQARLRRQYSIRLIGDALFVHLLAAQKIPYWKRAAMYLAVLLNGMWSFRRKRGAA